MFKTLNVQESTKVDGGFPFEFTAQSISQRKINARVIVILTSGMILIPTEFITKKKN